MITFTKLTKPITATILIASLTACVGGGTSQAVVANSAIAGTLGAAQAPVSESDLARSCDAISSELTQIYARFEQIQAQERMQQRRAGIGAGLLNAGISVLGGGAIANAGSADAIRTAGVATGIARGAANNATSISPDLQTVNSQTALAGRAAQLERTKVQKGCQS